VQLIFALEENKYKWPKLIAHRAMQIVVANGCKAAKSVGGAWGMGE
jgi:hypothetical protein